MMPATSLNAIKPAKIATMPMKDYNSNSDYQAKVNQHGNRLLTESATILSNKFPSEFNVADFGCSHGKNSMECVKAALDGYMQAKDPVSVLVYLNDLPTNDFGEVFNCLNNPAISYNEHPLFKRDSASKISTLVCGKSFNNQVLPKNTLHLAFSFNCLHWMEKDVQLSKGIIAKSSLSTPEENKIISKDAHEQLVRFLRSRATELNSDGRLILSIFKEFGMFGIFDTIWEDYVTSKGFQLNQFQSVSIPIYSRSTEEINSVLDEVKDQYKVVVSKNQLVDGNGFTPETLKAASFNVVARGVEKSGVFSTDSEIESFVDGFYSSFVNQKVDFEGQFHLLVLERL